MSSIRSRIEAFEALSKKSEDSSKDKKNASRKRFCYPGTNNRRGVPEQEDSVRDFVSMSKTASKTQDLSDFEADLQEVWSVRKNIHHNGATKNTTGSGGTSSPMPSVQVKAGQYSRHGAIPAQQTQGPSVLFPSKESQSKGFSFETKRTPLQEHNSKDTPWNVKTSSYSYNSQDAMRKQEHHPPDEKVSYAKRMAQGYLRSVGMAEYTPKTSGYTKQSQADESHAKQTWKKVDDDFDFSEPKPNPERKISNEAPRPTDGGKVTQFSHAKENQAKRTMGQSVHKFDDEGIGETPSKSSDVVKPSNETKVVETATVTWKNVDYNFDFGEIKASPLTDKKDTSEIARPNEDNGAQEHRQPNVKLNYAKRMAQGYLKSEGLGVYTPKTSGYVKESKSDESQSQWKKVDNENDFESKTSERMINSKNGQSTDEEMKEQSKTNEKLSYAKRMAQGYLKAEGLGVYTPQTSGYVKQSDDSQSHSTWKRLDNDDDVKTKSPERKISSENGLSTDEQSEKDHQPPQEKISYAKRMAKGYLRSVGMGEYTPPASGHTKQSKSDETQKQSSTWKNLKVSDEQDFEFDL